MLQREATLGRRGQRAVLSRETSNYGCGGVSRPRLSAGLGDTAIQHRRKA